MITTLSQPAQLTADARPSRLGQDVSPAQLALKEYAPITLREMAGVALLNRTDTKFAMTMSSLLAALGSLNGNYRVLEVDWARLQHYRTLYFDTADFTLYHHHHAGALDRYKVRSRAYVDSDLAFFEVKHKTNKKRTIKERLQTPQLMTQVNRELGAFLQDRYPYEVTALLPVLWNSFTRITLVSTRRAERVTLDVDLSFRRGDQQLVLPGIAIAEVKQEGFSLDSDFIKQMRALGVRPTSFSKCCLGISALYPQLKHNNFKPRHLLVQKLLREESHGYTH